MDLLDVIHEIWAIRAFIASSLVGIMCGVLGAFIVLRNMSLIGDALSHAILPGVVVAFILVGYNSFGFFIGAVVAGLLSAVAITWIQQKIKTKNDAAIGIVFTAMFSLGVIGISWVSKNEGVHLDLKDFLFGNILGVSDQDLILTAMVAIFVILSVVILYRYLFISTFQPIIARTMGISVDLIHYYLMLLLSFAVVASLQTVGVILVVAMLITPASTALLISDKLKNVIWLSGLIGLLSAILGLIISVLIETTPGPAMAVAATMIYIITAIFAPKRGLVAKFLNKRSQRSKIMQEDVLKQAFKLSLLNKLDFRHLKEKIELPVRGLKSHLKTLKKRGWIDYLGENIAITQLGKNQANDLVRAHRLWESYLVNEIGLTEGQIHEDAEKFEHLLTEDLLDELDRDLGYPKLDPHGSPIPAKEFAPNLALLKLAVNQSARIADRQIGEDITHELWKLGLLAESVFRVKSHGDENIIIQNEGGSIEIPNNLAERISVKIVKPDYSSSPI